MIKTDKNNFTMIISRTDSIGDVVLTLPLLGYVKQYFPGSRLIFMGRTYTKDVILLSRHVDVFLNYDDLLTKDHQQQVQTLGEYSADIFLHVFPVKKIARLAKKAGIPLRVGTTNRLYHWFFCNRMIRLSRKNSPLHEAQLNIRLLSFLEIPVETELKTLHTYYGIKNVPELSDRLGQYLKPGLTKIILHPCSKGSAREWGIENFRKLAMILPPDRYQVFISGTEQDRRRLTDLIKSLPDVTDLTGKLSLRELIAFINACDVLVAASTGPVHIAAALGKKAIALFSPARPVHPGRWMPLGTHAGYIVHNENCADCSGKNNCECIKKISPELVKKLLENEPL